MLFFFSFSYFGYFSYLFLQSKKHWDLNIDAGWNPSVSILISVHNEEKLISSKLKNLSEIIYPKEKMDIIVIDDASTDDTIKKIKKFMDNHRELQINLIEQIPWKGKAKALNFGLKNAIHDILVVTDADTLLPKDIISKTTPYFSDPSIGALTGRQVPINANENWVTESEEKYLNLMSSVRLGESKIHSTIRFEGSYSAFRKKAFDVFDEDTGADDSGTALKIIQNGYRAIFIPEAYAYGKINQKLQNKINTKIRRAAHLTALWFKCMKLILEGNMKLPNKIILPEIIISIFNPFVFVILMLLTLLLIFNNPITIIPIFLGACIALLIPMTRNYVVQGIFYQFILLYSIFLHIFNKKFTKWSR